ncbi:MAG: PfkB family carbohydrate kinase [Candidatus Latescibacterota bacterium]
MPQEPPRHPQVVGLGLCTVDLLFRVPRAPAFGQVVRAASYLRQGGGPVPTALVALARLGVSTAFISRVGDDEDGRSILAELAAAGVDVGGVGVEAGATSRVALVLVDEHTGERGFTAWPETCRPLAPGDLDRAVIAAARMLHLDDADAPSLQAARWARQAGVTVVFDGTWGHDDLGELLPLVDVPVVSEPFVAAWMPGTPPAKVLDRLWEYGPCLAVLTLGSRGCAVRWQAGTCRFPAFPVEVVDTTGAGDAFHGGLIYGLLQGWEVERTVTFASAVAALNCRRLGGRTGLPDLRQVEEFLARLGPLAPLPVG